jgi:calcium-dependent protein kinase
MKEGAFGKVYKSKATGGSKKVCAIKVIAFQRLEKDPKAWENELNISRRLKHPNIIQLHDAVVDEKEEMWYLVMEFCSGGDLFDWIEQNKYGLIPASIIARYSIEMLSGIKYIHFHKYCHRDIKPGNYMLPSKNDGAPLKLIDFGLATKFEPGIPMNERCGTTHYSAPEVIRCSYNERCDVWSVGICLYMICIGCKPFDDESEDTLAEIIKKGPQVFGTQIRTSVRPMDRLDHLGNDREPIMELIKELLQPDASKRPSARDVLKGNEWLQKKNKDPGCCTLL